MFTILANAAWFSALVTNRASAIAAAWFLVFAETDSPCTYSGGVSSAGDGTTLPFSDGLSFVEVLDRVATTGGPGDLGLGEELGVAQVLLGQDVARHVAGLVGVAVLVQQRGGLRGVEDELLAVVGQRS